MPPRVCGVAGAEKPGMSWQESGVVGSQTPDSSRGGVGANGWLPRSGLADAECGFEPRDSGDSGDRSLRGDESLAFLARTGAGAASGAAPCDGCATCPGGTCAIALSGGASGAGSRDAWTFVGEIGAIGCVAPVGDVDSGRIASGAMG